MPPWLEITLGVLAGATPPLIWLRRQEKRIDALWIFAFGLTGKNGAKLAIGELEEWKEELRAALPQQFRDTKHAAVDQVGPLISRNEMELAALEARVREL